jgi:hypothetical protein
MEKRRTIMRTLPAAFLTLVIATTVSAQEAVPAPAPASPDYSRPTLMRLFSGENAPRSVDPQVEVEVGRVTVRTKWLNIIGYLPFFAPLPGSYPTTTRQMINPFEMTHTEFAQTPKTWAAVRAENAEVRRIQRLEKEAKLKATVKATPE